MQEEDHQITIEEIKNEYERKIAALVYCLEEKSEENIDLVTKLKQLEDSGTSDKSSNKKIQVLNEKIKKKDLQINSLTEKMKQQNKGDFGVIEELNRRLQTLGASLAQMAEENNDLTEQLAIEQSSKPKYRRELARSDTPKTLSRPNSKPTLIKKSSTSDAELTLQQAYTDKFFLLESQVQRLADANDASENQIKELTEKLQKVQDKLSSSQESNEVYEKRVRKLDERMWDNLEKEGRRRSEAEENVKLLKKKVTEYEEKIESLTKELSEYDDSDSDSLSDSSDSI